MQYDELHIRLETRDDGAYDVVAVGEVGEAIGVLQLPFSDHELENFVLRVGRTRRGTRRLESPQMRRAQEFGSRLFDALFSAEVRDLYRDCSAGARAGGRGLRLKLSLGRAPELTDVPWEYLYDSPAFLSISQFTPVVRYLELPRARSPLAVELPLRVLAMVSAPSDEVALDIQDERRKVEQALHERLIERDLVEITWLEQATLRALQRELRRGPYHVIHFIGHGAYDSGLEESVLLLEDEDGRGKSVSGSQLGTMLADHTSLRLAVLNACEGARTSRDDPFSGVAAALVQHGLPAVIAMQFEITDDAAITFAEEFYAALVEGLPVDAALAEARKAIYATGNDIEWGTPVLFMRVSDGRVFELPKQPPVTERAAERAEDEQLASQEADAERPAQVQAEREKAPRVAREPADAQKVAARRTGLPDVPPNRRRTRVLAFSVIALVIVGVLISAVVLLGDGGGGTDGTNEIQATPPSALPTSRTHVVGRSVSAMPIEAVEVGTPSAARKVLVIGCIHGNQCSGMAITSLLAKAQPLAGVDLWNLRNLNPDGLASGNRENANGVDLNRNFPWQWDASVPGAGPRPLSEPESKAANRLIRRLRPEITIWYFTRDVMSKPPVVDTSSGGDNALMQRYASLVGLPLGDLGRFPGSAITWQNEEFPGTTAFAVDLPHGRLSQADAKRHAEAVLELARG